MEAYGRRHTSVEGLECSILIFDHTRITGREIWEECRAPSFDLVRHLKQRRLEWVGKTLRREESFLARRSLKELFSLNSIEGSVLMNAPVCKSFDELVDLARDTESWKLRVREIIYL